MCIRDRINAMYDLNMSLDDVTELGKDILRKERAFNAAAGFTKAHDRLPLYFSRESVAPHTVRWDCLLYTSNNRLKFQ